MSCCLAGSSDSLLSSPWNPAERTATKEGPPGSFGFQAAGESWIWRCSGTSFHREQTTAIRTQDTAKRNGGSHLQASIGSAISGRRRSSASSVSSLQQLQHQERDFANNPSGCFNKQLITATIGSELQQLEVSCNTRIYITNTTVKIREVYGKD